MESGGSAAENSAVSRIAEPTTGLDGQAKRLSPPQWWPRHGGAAGGDRANGRLGETVCVLGRCHAPVVQPRPGHGHRACLEDPPPQQPTSPRPRHGPCDAGDEPREARLRRRCDGHLWERDQEGQGIRERGGALDHVPRRQRPPLETRGEPGRCDCGPRGVPRLAEGQAAGLRQDGTPRAPPERLALPEVFLQQRAGHVGTAPHRGTGAARILPEDVRDSLRRRDGLPGKCETVPKGAVRDVPPAGGCASRKGSEASPEAIDEVLIPYIRRDGLADSRRRDVEQPLPSCRTVAAGGFRDEGDRVRFELETVLPRGLVDLRRIREESAVMEDLVEVADEGSAVPEIHQVRFELSHERLHFRDPTLPMTADTVQFPLRREAQAFFDQEELSGPAAAPLDELVHVPWGRVDESR